MTAKRRIMILISAVLIFSSFLGSCSYVKEIDERDKEEKMKMESGWTIDKDSGAYTYAFVFENVSDEVLSSAIVKVDAYDSDKYILEKSDNYYDFTIGPLWPGEKTAVYEELWYTREYPDQIWNETPEGFICEINKQVWMDLGKMHLIIDDSSTLSDRDPDYKEYRITVKNLSEEDFEWDPLSGKNTDDRSPVFLAFYRNKDGNITGAVNLAVQVESIYIKAGEKAVYDVSADFPPAGDPEFMIVWI